MAGSGVGGAPARGRESVEGCRTRLLSDAVDLGELAGSNHVSFVESIKKHFIYIRRRLPIVWRYAEILVRTTAQAQKDLTSSPWSGWLVAG